MAQLYFYYSAMNAGKSTSLLQSAYNYRERGMHSVIYTAALDDRYGVGKVTSRIGLQADAKLYAKGDDLFASISKDCEALKPDCIFIDEAQFLSREQVEQLGEVVDSLRIPVLCYGLRTDFQGELFEGSKCLLAWADELREIKTVCYCGKKAIMTVRLNKNGQPVRAGEQIHIGGNESYTSMCRRHFKSSLGINES